MHVVSCSASCLVALAACAWAAGPETVLVEAEAFKDTGGWVADPQFMDQMGSPFLLAHGLGAAVKDATTTARSPARTRPSSRTRCPSDASTRGTCRTS
jgi:hypothetical protein